MSSPVSVYGQTQEAREVAVLSHYPGGLYVFRTAWLYSRLAKNFAQTMTRLALSGEGGVRVGVDQIGQPTSILDMANQIVDP